MKAPAEKLIWALVALCVVISLITASNVATVLVLKNSMGTSGGTVQTTAASGTGNGDGGVTPGTTPGTGTGDVTAATDSSGNAVGTTAAAGTVTPGGSSAGKTGGSTVKKGGKPTTNAEIAAYYKTALDKARSSAKSATLTYDGATNYKSIFNAGKLTSIGKSLVNAFMKAGAKNEAVKPADLPPKGAACNLTANDVKSASCTESGSYYIVKLAVKDETNPKAGYGTGSIVTVITEDQITAPVKSYGLTLSNIKMFYYGANVEAKIEKSTGRMVSLNVDAPSMLQLDAKAGFISVTGAQVGIECVSKYTIAY